jgi:hypothetical protein
MNLQATWHKHCSNVLNKNRNEYMVKEDIDEKRRRNGVDKKGLTDDPEVWYEVESLLGGTSLVHVGMKKGGQALG